MLEIFNNTLLKIIHRQGSDADRKLVVLDSGELGYTTDTGRLYIGDGSTLGGKLVGNKYKGSSTVITNLSPCEIGDYGYETTTESLYVLIANSGNDLSDWKKVASPTKIAASSPITLSAGELNLNVASPLYIDNNTLKISLSSGNILDSSSVVDLIYPINCIFLTFANVNPSTYFVGTTWSQVSQGRFIAGIGTGSDSNSISKTLSAGNNTGEYQHTLTTAEIPSHTHEGYNVSDGEGGVDKSATVVWNNYIVGNDHLYHENAGHTKKLITSPVDRKRRLDGQPVLENIGGGQAHNNTPPSFGLYVWKRLS
jgi:microcystin-dependent protein